MSGLRRAVTIIVQPDGAQASRTLRVPIWVLRTGLGAAVVLAGFLLFIAALYGPIVRMAARVPGLEGEVTRLRADSAKVSELAAALDSVQSRYAQVRAMVGANIVPDPGEVALRLPVAPPLKARANGAAPRFGEGESEPYHWPLDEAGYLTRGQVASGGRDETHPGIDIAVPLGSIVRAAGGGRVTQTGEDPEYGRFVLLQHPANYETMYGHLSRVVVAQGAVVPPGAVLGLTGNSGRSTAPHLHFEVRRGSQAVDPLTMVKENR